MPKAKTAQSRAETTEQHAPSGAGNKENTPLQFDVRIQSIRPGDSIKGTASVNINGAFAIRGVKIIEGSNGLFVSMPSYKACLLYTSPSPRDISGSRMPSSA